MTLTGELVAFDTVTHTSGAPAREERALQELVAALLRAHGAEVELHEPDAGALRPHPMVPDGLTFEGRPQLVGRFRGSGGGRTLLLNGHVDVVDVEPRADWTQPDPFAAVVRDGRLYGRGSCDMKGGVASMIIAACTLAELGVPLAGDLIVNTVTEEESTGAGGLFAARLLQADGAIVPEPSGLAVWVACRGSLLPRITVRGRAGHAGIAPLAPEQGGAVNAIEKMTVVLEAVARLREHWAGRPRHPYSRPAIACRRSSREASGSSPTRPPARSSATSSTCPTAPTPPATARSSSANSRTGSPTPRRATRGCARTRPRSSGASGACRPPRSPRMILVQTLVGAGRDLGQPTDLGGLDNWHDGATLTVEAGIPAVCFGPGDVHRAHTVDEYVPIDDLVACAQRIALAAMRFCG